jgi:hypothetical protein
MQTAVTDAGQASRLQVIFLMLLFIFDMDR